MLNNKSVKVIIIILSQIIIFTLITTVLYAEILTDKLTVNKQANHSGINTVFVVPDEIIRSNNVREWEEILLLNGYNVVTRDKIKLIFEEKNLSQSGLTNNIIVGQLIGANGIMFIVRKYNKFTYQGKKITVYQNKLKFVSVQTGEILFIAEFTYTTNSTEKLSDIKEDVHAAAEWSDTILNRYKQELNTMQ